MNSHLNSKPAKKNQTAKALALSLPLEMAYQSAIAGVKIMMFFALYLLITA
ncbi:MAG: hypothetical protein HOE90_05280 [Bacteriovoracaceae bacterium]|jgi:hypothetical protein|nr:hypothetical protein [Bacteriovoracaceae bacterium]